MPIYEEEGKLTRADLLELRKQNKCKVCGARLDVFLDMETHKAYLACTDYPRTKHEGIEREASRYEMEGLAALNIPTRREIMNQEHGEVKVKALDKYIGGGLITKDIATEIVETLWGAAPVIEKNKAIIICQTYQLNPLMKHLYLVGYKRYSKERKLIVDAKGNAILDWSIQIGIGATRLMAQRKHKFTYLDMSPRKASDEEISKSIGGTPDPDQLYGFCWLRDVVTGAEAFGFKSMSKFDKIKGQEKGNTHQNQTNIRAERQALDRLCPGEMPANVEVFDERYAEDAKPIITTEKDIIEGEARLIDETTGEIIESETPNEPEPEAVPEEQHWCEEHDCAYELKHSRYGDFYAHKQGKGWCNEKKKEAQASIEPEPEPSPETPESELGAEASSFIDMDWLRESLKTLQATNLKAWTESNLLSYIKTTYKVEGKTVLEAVAMLDKGAATHFVKRVQDTLDMA